MEGWDGGLCSWGCAVRVWGAQWWCLHSLGYQCLALIGYKWIPSSANSSAVLLGISTGAAACRTNPRPREHPLKSAPGIPCACSQHLPGDLGRELGTTDGVFVLKGFKLALPRGFQPLKGVGRIPPAALQVQGVLAVSHPVGFAHHPSWPGSSGVGEGLLPVWALLVARARCPCLFWVSPGASWGGEAGRAAGGQGRGRRGTGLAHNPGIFPTPSSLQPAPGKSQARI